ncbi:DUF799 domain-containing protein [Nitrospinae bacterium AH-259-F20]|nr:DUF799 domain-containing protein [Nitrospinae bacterium AH-259-F20]
MPRRRLWPKAASLALTPVFLLGVDVSAGASKRLAFTPQRGQTVAVLPFRFAVGKGSEAGLPAGASQVEAVALVREQMAANMRRGPWRLLEFGTIDAVLASRGWSEPNALDKADPRDVGRALGADLLCYGEVNRWGRQYMLIHSQVEVGARLRIVSSSTGKVVWSKTGQKVRTAGLTKIPTGIGSAAITPLLGMQKSFLYEVTNDMAREMTAPLVASAAPAAPAATPPTLLVAAAHAGTAGGRVKPGDRITVVAIGDPGLTATFAVGPARRDLPMTEFGPGRYVGAYDVAAGDRFAKAPIIVHLFTRAGGLASSSLAYPLVSTLP